MSTWKVEQDDLEVFGLVEQFLEVVQPLDVVIEHIIAEDNHVIS